MNCLPLRNFKLMRPLNVLLVIFLFSFKNQNNPKPCFAIKQAFDYATSDLLGNIYILNKNRTELLKYNFNGQFINRYSNLSLGKIQHVDVSNPLRILLFYHQRQALIFLDSQLSPNGDPVYLEKTGIMNASLICSSSLSNGFWIYNEPENELYRYNSEGVLQVKSGNLKWFLGDDFHPSQITESNSRLFVSDPNGSIYLFDQFGTHKKTIPLKTHSEIFANSDYLWYMEKNKITRYHFKTATIDQDSISNPFIKNIYFSKNRIIEIYSDSIKICKY